MSIIGPRASAKDVEIRSVIDAPLPSALIGDAGRIRQILLNLVSNAVKFTADGEVLISTRRTSRIGSHATIEWAISDTGIGIAPEKIGALFTDFVQADNSINRRFGGSGLGLAICKRLIEQMGGEIKVKSMLGNGSTFTVNLTLPVADQVLMPDQDDQTASRTSSSGSAALPVPAADQLQAAADVLNAGNKVAILAGQGALRASWYEATNLQRAAAGRRPYVARAVSAKTPPC